MQTDIKDEQPELIPAASVIVVNTRHDKLTTLLIHRSPELRFQADLWAFPGGHIDSADRGSDGSLATAEKCALRETEEEVGLKLEHGELRYLARWITPRKLPRRFDTWFFLAVGDYRDVRVDGSEIIDHVWCRPDEALEAHNRNIRRLTPPAFVFLARLKDMQAARPQNPIEPIHPDNVPFFRGRLVDLPDGQCTLYEQDEAYHHTDLDRPGPRHRLWMLTSGWSYENRY